MDRCSVRCWLRSLTNPILQVQSEAEAVVDNLIDEAAVVIGALWTTKRRSRAPSTTVQEHQFLER